MTRYLGILATTLGEWESAGAHFAAARATGQIAPVERRVAGGPEERQHVAAAREVGHVAGDEDGPRRPDVIDPDGEREPSPVGEEEGPTLLGQVGESTVANIVDPNYTVVAKVRKRYLPPPPDQPGGGD